MRITCTPSPSMISDTLEADTIVIDVQTGAYYTLTPVAGRLWTQAQDTGACDPADETTAAVLRAMLVEGLLLGDAVDEPAGDLPDPSIAFTRYTDMEELLLADPIHEVDAEGWPVLRPPAPGA